MRLWKRKGRRDCPVRGCRTRMRWDAGAIPSWQDHMAFAHDPEEIAETEASLRLAEESIARAMAHVADAMDPASSSPASSGTSAEGADRG